MLSNGKNIPNLQLFSRKFINDYSLSINYYLPILYLTHHLLLLIVLTIIISLLFLPEFIKTILAQS